MKIEILNSKIHNREKFACDEDLLDRYLKKQASQDVKRNLATCTVLVDDENEVKGYYTLSSGSIDKDTLPPDITNKFPASYSELPYALLGRLAVDNTTKGLGFGEILLMDALVKCSQISAQMGILGVVVDPINDKAVKFYKKYGFVLLPTSGKMILSIKTINKLVFHSH
ncbi:GNAT family N-acetyltransferase [Myroides marinus]|uniref:GNAT family N-acetyltransferase n=1 Tax=Myroides marinus TaxID=703342 RepID=UPI000741C731|nr:GNAT family N-acetyltransferase [Myroides marinus]KUF40755.1 GCN5 family acetyltransferase [Myroides marinus]MDM1347607.1 GNAT family N-acetyltransferase [Myroides marinus]MDM1352300.1 GNAT family N-acetyltransferase [Myroides marinus]MDM1356093.1 GNAT family N-acetyltransferase [Myroides marinus]MDM1359498.1 GNAT family N-acetyltransferase [Myroides marinus]